MKSLGFALVLALTACSAAPRSAPEAAAVPQPVPSTHPPTPKAEPSFAEQVGALLDAVPQSGAVVVLPFDTSSGLLIREKGTSASRHAHRPGSTVKPLLAMLSADAGILVPHATHTCSPAHTHTDFGCFAEHGDLTLERAIATSCNSYFYEVAAELGTPRVVSGFGALGFGKEPGLVMDERVGFLPSQSELDALPDGHAATWPGYAKLIGIGHGPFEATPLQLAVAYRTLAQRIGAERGKSSPRAEVYTEIERGLQAAVVSDEGTARGAAVSGLDVVGKTGTAEAHGFGEPDRGKENGWFVGYAPKTAPEVVVAVLLLEAENGGKDAARVAGQVFGSWTRTR